MVSDMELMQVVDRKNEIRAAALPASVIKQRIAQAADELSKAGDVAARVEVANEAISKLTSILYQRDIDGIYPNLDNVTKRIIIAAPWGSVGWKRWGMRHWEAGIVRKILMPRQANYTQKQRPPLFVYSESRYWYLNLFDYPTLETAQHWLQRSAITVQEWRQAL